MRVLRSSFLRLSFVIVLVLSTPGVVLGMAGQKAKRPVDKPEVSKKLSKDDLLKYWNLQQKGDEKPPSKAVGDVTHMLSMDSELLAKAQPDECFGGIGVTGEGSPPCTAPAVPKVNQSYVWAMTKVGDNIWFGTMSNTLCLVLGTLATQLTTDPIPGFQSPSCVCEFSETPPPLLGWPAGYPDQLKDVRTPKMYTYNTVTQTLTERGPDLLHLFDWVAVARTMGFRAAGSFADVVFIAGPTLSNDAINMFAFQASTGEYLGYHQYSSYNNIRKFLVVNGALYTGVGRTGGGGRVLKWTGSVSDPFQFEEVGNIDASVAELAEHEGRIFVTTWPDSLASGILAGLWMSPAIAPGGLTAADAGNWTEVWRADDYEPDPLTARVYGGGALASYDGYLFWGTMHVPFLAFVLHYNTYGASEFSDVETALETLLGTHRSISIFRGSGFTTGSPEIRVAYGMPQLPVFTPPAPPDTVGTWALVNNNMPDPMPLFGPSGFGNFFNNYTWSMSVFDSRLWVGTMDWSYLANDLAPGVFNNPQFTIPVEALPQRPSLFGADLFFFPDSSVPAIPETLGGVGNYTNYGIRNMIADDRLYLGMANPMNLLTDTTDNKPEGGWELLGLTARSPNTPVGTNVEVTTSDGIRVTFCSVAVPGHTDSVPLPYLTNILATIPWVTLEPPTGYPVPNPIYLIATSAFWRYSCSTEDLARICIPSADATAHVFQLQYSVPGQMNWVDITSTSSAPGMVCATITRGFMGIIGIAAAAVPPTLTAVNPPLFPEGQVVTLTGSGYLAGTTAVTFNGIAATSFVVVDDATITAVVPAGIPYGPVTVAVTTVGGTASLVVDYAAPQPPTITSVAPPVFDPGQSVAITGTNFSGATAVTFNGIPATSFAVVDDGHINAVVPPGLAYGQVTVQVTTPNGSASMDFDWAEGQTIPTLSEWGLLLLAMALFSTALKRLRRRQLPPPA